MKTSGQTEGSYVRAVILCALHSSMTKRAGCRALRTALRMSQQEASIHLFMLNKILS